MLRIRHLLGRRWVPNCWLRGWTGTSLISKVGTLAHSPIPPTDASSLSGHGYLPSKVTWALLFVLAIALTGSFRNSGSFLDAKTSGTACILDSFQYHWHLAHWLHYINQAGVNQCGTFPPGSLPCFQIITSSSLIALLLIRDLGWARQSYTDMHCEW